MEVKIVKKNFIKKIAAVAMAAVMAVGCAMSAMAADAYTANLGMTDGGWYPINSMELVKTDVTGPGTYTFSYDLDAALGYDGSSSGLQVFVIDVVGAGAAFASYNVSDLTVKADGTSVAVDMSKLVVGDLEGNGNYRIEIYNQYGSTKEAPAVDPATFAVAQTLEVSFTLVDPNAETEAPSTEAPTTTAPAGENETTTASNETTAGNAADATTAAGGATGTPNTGDSSMVATLLAVAALSAVVVLKKRTATN